MEGITLAPVHSSPARRLASSLALALLAAACGADTSAGTEQAATTDATSTAGEVMTTGTTEAGSTAAPTGGTTGDAPTTSTSTTGALTDTGEPATTGSTGEPGSAGEPADTGDEPPADPCAHQDEAPPAVDAPKAINDDPAFIQVYVNNIENLKLQGEQCPGDWTDLIAYMKSIKPSPDLFLVQQISDSAQLDTLVQRMTDELPGIFEGFIADADPWTQLSPCGKEKEKQTNAIIIRQGRFARVGEAHVWQSWVNKDGECVRNHQARTRNVMVKLHDKIADKDVTVASLHWATAQGDGPDPACAKQNVLEADAKLHKKGFGGDLLIFGGDFNEPDRKAGGGWRPWYAEANGEVGGALNYRDPIFRACESGGGLQACLDDNWTIGGERRIDMLFGQDGAGCRARTRRAHTITYAEAEAAAKQLTGDTDPDLNYSEHRGVRAEFYY